MNKNIADIIPNILEHYDKNMEKYKYLFDKIKDTDKQIEIKYVDEDMKKNIIIFKDENGKEIKKSQFEIAGIYFNSHKIWIWGWAMPQYKKNLTYISRTMLYYGLDVDYVDYPMLKLLLTTSRFKIFDLIQLDMHAAITSYLTKIPIIYPYKIKKGIYTHTYYIFLLDF